MALALMVVGALLFGVSVVRSRSDDKSPAAASSDERPNGRGVPGTGPCGSSPCPANGDGAAVRGYEVPSVAVDTKDANHLVVTDNNLVGGRCASHASFDGGRTWQDGVFKPPPGYTDCTLDSGGFLAAGNVAIGPSGTVYFAFASAGGEGGEKESIVMSTSLDGGRTFTPARVAVQRRPTDPAFRRPSLSVAPGAAGKDRVLLSFWGCPQEGRREICNKAMFAGSPDGGQSFSPAVESSPPGGGNSPSPAVIGADGAIYVLFLGRKPPEDTELVLGRSADGGATFTPTTVGPLPRADLGGRYDSAKLVLGPKGELYTVYSHKPAGAFEVAFRRSQDNGKTWSEELRLNKSSSGSYFSPNISVAPNGRIDVIFYQRSQEDVVPARQPAGEVGVSDTVLWTSSTDGGESFGVDRRINFGDRGIDRRLGYWEEVGDWYIPGVASSDSAGYFVWSDTRRGDKNNDNQDTFLRRIDFAGSGRDIE